MFIVEGVIKHCYTSIRKIVVKVAIDVFMEIEFTGHKNEKPCTGYIIGAYPCAPSFHQRRVKRKRRNSGGNSLILGYPGSWSSLVLNIFTRFRRRSGYCATTGKLAIVVTAIMETMRRRSENGGFGLASVTRQRKACVEYYRHLHQKISKNQWEQYRQSHSP